MLRQLTKKQENKSKFKELNDLKFVLPKRKRIQSVWHFVRIQCYKSKLEIVLNKQSMIIWRRP